MSLGEQVILRVFLILILMALVFCFRLVVSLLKKVWQAITGSKEGPKKAAQPSKPPVQPIPPAPVQPINPVPAQPVNPAPVQPVNPSPVQPVNTVPAQPDQTQPQYPSGDIPLGSGEQMWAAYATGRRLIALNGPLAGREFVLNAGYSGRSYTVGRNPDCDISFPAQTPGISGLHCKVTVYAHTGSASAVLEDCNSTYGTFLMNGQRVMPGQQYPLKPGDIFFLAGQNGTAFRFET